MRREIMVDGLRVVFEENRVSSDSAIVFVHGAGKTRLSWKNQIDAAFGKFTRIILDLPGHGESEGSGYDSLDEYADFVYEFLGRLDFAEFVLVGHSMGGAIVQLFTLKYHRLLSGIVIANSGAKLRVHPSVFEAILNNDNIVAKLAYCDKTPVEIIQEAESDFGLVDKTIRHKDFSACDNFNLMSRVSRIDIPALIIAGSCDRLTPIKHARFLNDSIERSELSVIENAGHMVMWEKPVEFNNSILKFLRRLQEGLL